MKFISESESTRLISHELAFEAVRKSLVAAASPNAQVFPAVIAQASDPQNTFSLKSGSTPELAGLKVGSFWPNNPSKGRPRHSSTIFLIDQESGRIGAVVEASAVNAYRTAAADAVAAKALARPESETLAIFGAGNQALFECCALARILPLKRLHVVARNRDKANDFVTKLGSLGVKLDVHVSTAEEACRNADIIVTATPSRVPPVQGGMDPPRHAYRWHGVRRARQTGVAERDFRACEAVLSRSNRLRSGNSSMSAKGSKVANLF